jgi:2-hydroxy-6-oxonona-2,4-dienedioate hydrolase
MTFFASATDHPKPNPCTAQAHTQTRMDLATEASPAAFVQVPDLSHNAEYAHVLQAARRVHTPCGAGQLVWHVWGEQGADPALPPLVLLHGGSGSWTHWLRNLLPLVASGRRVYVPDLPGFGDSALPFNGGDVDSVPEPLEAGLVLLLGDTACDLMGFSFGGMTAGLLAHRFPARVLRLVLVGAPGFGIQPLVPFKLKGWRHLPDAEQQRAAHQHNLQVLMLHNPAAITPWVCQLQAANAARDRMPGRRLSRTDILARALPEIHCPLYVLYGDQDPFYLGQVGLYQAALQTAPHFKVFRAIQASGHWTQFEQHEIFNAEVLGLLSEPVQ